MAFTNLTPPGREMVVWKTEFGLYGGDAGYDSLLIADVEGDSLAVPDTISTVLDLAVDYSGAASMSHEWVAVNDPNYDRTRLFSRRIGGRWRELANFAPRGPLGVSLAPLTDSTALVVVGGGRIRRGIFTSTGWVEEPPDLTPQGFAVSPLRPDGEGGYWVAWTSGEESVVVTRRLADGTWTPQDSVTADYLPSSPYQITNSIAISLDSGARPALAWMAYGQSGTEYVYVSWPTATGWTRGEQLPGSASGGAPQLTVDENGDVWIGWWKFFDGIMWRHTYTTVTTDTPTVTNEGERPRLRWALSASGPGTWWAVLRAAGEGAFERIARVQAGADTAMSWADTSAPLDQRLRYAIRRECRDVRYQWTSAEAGWEPRGRALGLSMRSANPAATRVEFEIVGANQGALELRLYDVLGREVLHGSAVAAGAGRDAVSLPLGSGLHAGLYLLRVSGADGRSAPVAKLAIVR